ncbi:MAG: hypothetical protein HYU28_08935 [Actinobacteria bacterium]|nr:hypothetical protein [Actinomycetota bacterium]
MTKTVQIRNVPDDVHATLRSRAAAAGRSLSDYLLEEIERVARRPPIADVLLRASERDWGIPPGEAGRVVRELRDER